MKSRYGKTIGANFTVLLMVTSVMTSIIVLFAAPVGADAPAIDIWTTDENGDDKTDFEPEDTVYVWGKGFNVDDAVIIDITRPDGSVDTGTADTDSNGEFVYAYDLDGIVGNYTVNATDGVNSAQTTFTDLWFETFEDASCDWNERRYIFSQGDTVYTAAYVWPWRGYKFEWYDPSGNLVHTYCQGGVWQVTDSYILGDNAPVGTWYIKKIEYKYTDCTGDIRGTEIIRFNVYDKQATLLAPIDDSYVRYFDRQKGDPFVNDGNDYCRDQNYDNDELHVKWRNKKIWWTNYLDRKRAFLKFDLSDIPNDVIIVSAKLHLDRYTGENDTEKIGTYFVSDDTWAEGGITWLNQPDMMSLVDAIDVGPHDGGYIWDVTSKTTTEAAGDDILSLGLKFIDEETKRHQDFYDRESDAGLKPYLEIITRKVVSPVGGIVVPVDKLGLMTPYVVSIVFLTIMISMIAIAVYTKHVNHRKKK